VICKPIDACGTPASHQLVVIVSIEDFALVRYPCIVQQYWNHNERLYKVYVIDRDVMVYERPSLPDLPACRFLKSVAFDSSESYPSLQSFQLSQEKSMLISPTNYLKKERNVSHEVFRDAALKIADGFGLSLFGFDVIIPYDSSSFLDHHEEDPILMIGRPPLMVIDVNYFPSFKEVSDFPERLREFIRRRAGYGRFTDSPPVKPM
jgi:hypothetical protein